MHYYYSVLTYVYYDRVCEFKNAYSCMRVCMCARVRDFKWK